MKKDEEIIFEDMEIKNSSSSDCQQEEQIQDKSSQIAENSYNQILNALKSEPEMAKDTIVKQETEVSEIDEVVKQDFQKVAMLLKMGLINPLQGQNLMNLIIKKACNGLLENGNQTSLIQETQITNGFEEFAKENPDFFNTDGRNEVLNYIKSINSNVDKDELTQISKLVENIENKAIDRYLKKIAHEENLTKLNEAAKQKLQSNAQNSANQNKNFSVFTREQIGKMSGTEFVKNEKLIMEQLKKGLIR